MQPTPPPLGPLSQLTLTPSICLSYYKNPTILNQSYSHDIIPGVYEGGFQLWECEVEFLKWIVGDEQMMGRVKKASRVVEIGCGHGLVGVLVGVLGDARVTMQDYNNDVIEQLTKPTV
jgi:hypothetical protein